MSEKLKGAADRLRRAANSTAPAGAGGGKELWLYRTSAVLLFTFLPADDLTSVFDAFALVGLRRAIGADLGRDLAHALAVGPAQGNDRRPLTGDPDIVWDRKRDVVAVPELQVQRAALNRGTISDTIDFESDRGPLRYAGHHVVNQRSGRSPHRARVLRLAFWGDRNRAVGNRGGDLVAHDEA